jgi:hypothetical protein
VTRREFKDAYTVFLEEVMSLLYYFDPDGVGRSIDAPPDEYRDLATLLLGPLSRTTNPSEAASEIRKLVPAAEPDLIKALWAARQKFESD